jgi:phenylpyruvate tautomerase PptA (4-oxalocrotonate tautomerase family)
MPIVDLEIVGEGTAEGSAPYAKALANALGTVFGTPPGRTWVRVRFLARDAYAENETTLSSEDLPVFVTVLHARPPLGEALSLEAKAITVAVSKCLACPEERVHVQYAPAALGRQAFGGRFVQ